DLYGPPRGTRVARVHHLAARPGRPDDVLGADHPSVDLDRLAAMQLTEQRALGDAQRSRPLRVEPTQTVVLDQRVAHRSPAVLRGIRHDVVLLPLDAFAGLQLPDRDLERHPLDAEVDRVVQDRPAPGRAPERDRLLTPLQP